MTDKLESEEFNELLTNFRVANYQYFDVRRHSIIAFIRQHFTPKTVEESYRLVKVQGVLTLASYHQYSDYASLFYGTRKQCEAEKQRLESLTKGREEKPDFHCASESFGGEPCDKQCKLCKNAPLESSATPNRDNYRAELLSVATAAMNGMLASNPVGQHTNIELPNPKQLAEYSIDYAKELLTAIDKEVKSNPASE